MLKRHNYHWDHWQEMQMDKIITCFTVPCTQKTSRQMMMVMTWIHCCCYVVFYWLPQVWCTGFPSFIHLEHTHPHTAAVWSPFSFAIISLFCPIFLGNKTKTFLYKGMHSINHKNRIPKQLGHFTKTIYWMLNFFGSIHSFLNLMSNLKQNSFPFLIYKSSCSTV